VAEAADYAIAIALFGFVICASGFVRHETLILACIPPMFVATISGFAMWVHLYGLIGAGPALVPLLPGYPVARYLGRRLTIRDQLLLIYVAWLLGMIVALAGFSFPDPV
jgi:hypothetical protein